MPRIAYSKNRSGRRTLRWLEGKHIAFLGDSITADLKCNYVSLFIERLSENIDAASVAIVNSGVDSSSVVDALDRLPDVLIENDPDILVVFVGVNDSKIFRHINRPLLTISAFERGYRSLLDRADVGRVRLKVLLTLPPLLFESIKNGDLLANYWYWIPSEYMKYVEVIRKLGRSPNRVVADVYRQFKSRNCDQKQLFQVDGVHPNVYGHRLIADAILQALSTYKIPSGIE